MTAQAQEIVRAHLAGANEQTELTDDQRSLYRQRIKERLQARDAVMVAHYYTDPEIRPWPRRPAAAWPIPWKWRASAATTRPAP